MEAITILCRKNSGKSIMEKLPFYHGKPYYAGITLLSSSHLSSSPNNTWYWKFWKLLETCQQHLLHISKLYWLPAYVCRLDLFPTQKIATFMDMPTTFSISFQTILTPSIWSLDLICRTTHKFESVFASSTHSFTIFSPSRDDTKFWLLFKSWISEVSILLDIFEPQLSVMKFKEIIVVYSFCLVVQPKNSLLNSERTRHDFSLLKCKLSITFGQRFCFSGG